MSQSQCQQACCGKSQGPARSPKPETYNSPHSQSAQSVSVRYDTIMLVLLGVQLLPQMTLRQRQMQYIPAFKPRCVSVRYDTIMSMLSLLGLELLLKWTWS